MKELIEIQNALNVPKERRNDFGKYNYRSAEDILKAAKPLLKLHGCVLLLTDEVKEIGAAYVYNTQTSDNRSGKSANSSYNGTRIYVESTATIINSAGEKISTKGLAREEVAKAGMDAAQITGAASSYARKYALNGLFAIDDGVDADRLNASPQYTQQPSQVQHPSTQETMSPQEHIRVYVVPEIEQAQTSEDLTRIFNQYVMYQGVPEFISALSSRRKALGIRKSNEQV